MSRLLFVLGLVFCVACSDVDDDMGLEQDSEELAGDAGIGMKSQALGTACPAQVDVFMQTSNPNFNASGWAGTVYLSGGGLFWGQRDCHYLPPAWQTYYVGYNVGRSCTIVAGTGNKKFKCREGVDWIYPTCPDQAGLTGGVSGFRQAAGSPTQPWSAAGQTTIYETPGLFDYATNSGSYDSINQRIWCGYTTRQDRGSWKFYRPEGF